ncbi:MAG TPA: hypothetical protein VGN32_11300 [Ktedonobacterales bacterium]|jgi:hypothetical protein|nr:hypothetical protein [Ktedonobacterales bacterium]
MGAGPELNGQQQATDIVGRERARASARITRKLRRRQWFGSVTLLVLAFIVMGVAPLALAARIFGLVSFSSLRLPILGGAAQTTPLIAPTATEPALSLPRPGWIAQPTAVVVDPRNTLAVAQLQPGFPVELQAAQSVNGTRWYMIRWHGPTTATGGQGWVRDNALAATGVAGPVVGDAAALAPALASALRLLGPDVALAVYFPQAQQLYLTNGDNAYVLGSGARSLVLAALVAQVGASATGPQPTATPTGQATPAAQGTPTPARLSQQVASGDVAATAMAYQQIGGAAGLDTFLGAFAVTGITPGATDWAQIQATPRALAEFYAELGGQAFSPVVNQLDSARRAQVQALLTTPAAPPSSMPIPADLAALLVPPGAGAHVALVAGSGQETDGWSVNVAGLVTLPNGLSYVEALCVHGAASEAAGAQALQTAQSQLAAAAQQ